MPIPALEAAACPLCGATDAQMRYRLPDVYMGLPGTFTLAECRSCGLLYQNPRPGPDAIGFYYPPEYDPFMPPPWANPRVIQRLTHLYGLKKRWWLLERFAPGRAGKRRILDVGCATGTFLAAGDDGWQKAGVELAPEAAERARRQFGLKVYQGSVEQPALDGQQFDVITMWDVLEHLHDPHASLLRVRELLRPDGVFVARVPNRAAWDASLFGRYWAGLDQPRHMFVPDPTTLTAMLNQAGFRVIELVCMGGTHAMLVLSWRFWLRQHLPDGWRLRLARRILDNLPVRLALLPLIWVVERMFRQGATLTVVAQPA